jgi:hypothetical protein
LRTGCEDVVKRPPQEDGNVIRASRTGIQQDLRQIRKRSLPTRFDASTQVTPCTSANPFGPVWANLKNGANAVNEIPQIPALNCQRSLRITDTIPWCNRVLA